MISSVRQRVAAVSILLLLLALWLRITQLYTLPVFSDETDHLYWSQEFYWDQTDYPFLMDGKFFLGILVAQFQPLGPSPLWLARAVVGLFSVLSVAASVYLGRQLGSNWAGLLAGLLYTLLPHAVFHERQMLADPLMAAFGAVAIALTWRVIKSRNIWMIVGAGIAIALAVLSKVFGLLYFAYPAVAALLFLWLKRKPINLNSVLSKNNLVIRRLTASVILAALFIAGFLLLLRQRLGYDTFKALANSQIGYTHCPRIICEGSITAQFADLQEALPVLADTLGIYLGWPIVLLSLFALPLAPRHQREVTRWLSLSALITFFAWLSATSAFPPRYLSFLLVPIVTLGSAALVNCIERIHTRTKSIPVTTGAATAGLLLILLPTINTAWLIAQPYEASMPAVDKSLFNGNFRPGFQEAAHYIVEHNPGHTQVHILAGGKFDRTQLAYLDREVYTAERTSEADFLEVGQRLLQDAPIYHVEVVDNDHTASPDIPFDTSEIGRYFYTDSQQVRLSQLTSANAELRERLFRRFFTLPEELKQHYTDLVNALPTDTPFTLFVYPPNHTDLVASLVADRQTNATVLPLGNAWPVKLPQLTTELSRATNDADIRLVFDQETNGDPGRLIETAFNTQFYRIDEQWFTPLRMIRYTSGTSTVIKVPASISFGESIYLDSVYLLDTNLVPGDLLRLRLNWHSLAPTSQQFKIFVHLFAGETIIAQHDGQPVGELRPTNTWQVGEQITDQFAMILPADVPPGTYQLRIGLYDLSTQERLPATLPDGTSVEFFTGGTIVIK